MPQKRKEIVKLTQDEINKKQKTEVDKSITDERNKIRKGRRQPSQDELNIVNENIRKLTVRRDSLIGKKIVADTNEVMGSHDNLMSALQAAWHAAQDMDLPLQAVHACAEDTIFYIVIVGCFMEYLDIP